jgi:oligopeptidase A
MTNILLKNNELPPFSKIKTSDITPAIEHFIKIGKVKVKEVLEQKEYSWNNLIAPLDEVDDALGQAWSPVSHLNSVKNSKEMRKEYEKCIEQLTQYHTEISQNEDLYQAYKGIQDNQMEKLDRAQQKVINDAIRDFKLSGIALNKKDKARYKEIQEQLSKLSTQFENNILDATNEFSYHVKDKAELAGMPEHSIISAQEKAKQKDMDGYLLGVDFPTYYAVITYADNQNLRKVLYKAYTTRASEQASNNKFDNSKVMQDILKLRHEKAKLLGFNNFAELSIAPKMAETTDQVMEFIFSCKKI